MADIQLPILPGTLPVGTCYPASVQELLNLLAANMQAIIANGGTGFNFGSSTPPPAQNGLPWINTNDGRIYVYDGGWVAPYNYTTFDRRLFFGTLTDLQTYDGGDTNAPSDRSGPTWVEDTAFRGRSPMGVGAIPTANPAKNLALGEAFGEGAHQLVTAELPAHAHAITGLSTDNATNTPNGGHVIIGTSPPLVLSTDATGGDIPHNNVAPVVGIYVIKWSGRALRIAP